MRQHLDINHEGTLGADGRVKMTFDEDSVSFLQGVLIEMYEDPIETMIREIFSNARDAHVAAGRAHVAVEVELPAPLRQTLIIRDRGTGMSSEFIVQKYSKYGASTKRHTNDEVGMLGLGAKSPLAYTSQFTIVTAQNGIKTTVLITRDDDGGGAVQIVDTCSTDDPDGTEVTIPTVGYITVCEKAEHFFRFVDPKVVLVNGKPPAKSFPAGRDIVMEQDSVIVTFDENIYHDYLVMGNVPYRVPSSQDPLVGAEDAHAIVHVPIGVVDFTPNRESLKLTPRTLEALHEARTWIKYGTERRVQAEVSAAPTFYDALKVAMNARDGFVWALDNLKYRGHDVPAYLGGGACHSWNPNNTWDRKARRVDLFSVDELVHPATLHVIGHKQIGVRDDTKARVKKYIEDNKLDVDTVAFYPLPFTTPTTPWFGPNVMTVSHDVIKAIVLPNYGGGAVKPSKGKYRVVGGTRAEMLVDGALMDPTTFVYIMAGTLKNERTAVRRDLQAFDPKMQLVIIESNREAALKRDVPGIQDIEVFVRDELAKFGTMSDADAFVSFGHRTKYWDEHVLAHLNPEDIVDPDLRATLEAWRSATTRPELVMLHALARRLGQHSDSTTVGATRFTARLAHFATQRYRLIQNERYYGVTTPSSLEKAIEHARGYINGVYLTTRVFSTRKTKTKTKTNPTRKGVKP